MAVRSRFKVLLAEKEMRERRNITLKEVQRETGVSIYTVTGFSNDTLQEYPGVALDKLCAYLGCALNELLIREDDTSIGSGKTVDDILNPEYGILEEA